MATAGGEERETAGIGVLLWRSHLLGAEAEMLPEESEAQK
jgi:hypothetical protein